MKRSNLIVIVAIDNSHSLEAHSFHGGLGGEKEAMVEVVEKVQSAREVR